MSVTVTNRPTDRDEDVLAAVAEAILPEIMGWGDFKEIDRDDILKTLTGVLQDAYDLDSYKLAKALDEDLMTDANGELVSILEQVRHKASQFAREKTRKWVAANNVTPPYPVGTRVTWRHGWDETRTGIIVAIKPDVATYTIQEDGASYPAAADGFHCGWIVPYEKTSKIDAAATPEGQR